MRPHGTLEGMTDASSLAILSDAVRGAADSRERHRQLSVQLGVAGELLDARDSELADLQQRLQRETADVERLEHLSPTRLWALMKGDAEDRLMVEKAEQDAAARALAAAQQRRDAAAAEVATLRAAQDALGHVDARYAGALADLDDELQRSQGASAAELGDIAARLGEAAAEKREIDEASAALVAANAELVGAIALLDSAGGWSTYDTFFGGGFVTDLMKHDRIDEATAGFTRVNRALERLATELADIHATPVDGVGISEGLAVFDVLFDNFLSDWMVREQIAQARSASIDLQVRLSELTRYLAERGLAVATQLGDLTRRREAILLAVA